MLLVVYSVVLTVHSVLYDLKFFYSSIFCLVFNSSQLGKRESPRFHINTSISNFDLNVVIP